MTSIRNAGGFTKACGTRYHPSDIYDTWKKQTMIRYNEETGEIEDIVPVWDIKEHVVERDNIFLWPREVRTDGKAFGFNLLVSPESVQCVCMKPSFCSESVICWSSVICWNLPTV